MKRICLYFDSLMADVLPKIDNQTGSADKTKFYRMILEVTLPYKYVILTG